MQNISPQGLQQAPVLQLDQAKKIKKIKNLNIKPTDV